MLGLSIENEYQNKIALNTISSKYLKTIFIVAKVLPATGWH